MYKNAGFTLIELLVVVLIIGILAAVALPQYEKSVAKSRMAAELAKVIALETAEKEFKLANGYYTNDLSAMSIDTGEWSCTRVSGLPGCQHHVLSGLIWEISFGGPTTPSTTAYRLYCIAAKNKKIYQDICSQYGSFSHENGVSNYYLVRLVK